MGRTAAEGGGALEGAAEGGAPPLGTGAAEDGGGGKVCNGATDAALPVAGLELLVACEEGNDEEGAAVAVAVPSLIRMLTASMALTRCDMAAACAPRLDEMSEQVNENE